MLPGERDEIAARLRLLERTVKQYGASTSDQLLDRAAEAEERLDQWFQMEGNR